MYEHVMVETLSVAFNAISGGGGGGGGNVYIVVLHVNAATLKGLTSLIQFQKIIGLIVPSIHFSVCLIWKSYGDASKT